MGQAIGQIALGLTFQAKHEKRTVDPLASLNQRPGRLAAACDDAELALGAALIAGVNHLLGQNMVTGT
jgi:hypothetical protein